MTHFLGLLTGIISSRVTCVRAKRGGVSGGALTALGRKTVSIHRTENVNSVLSLKLEFISSESAAILRISLRFLYPIVLLPALIEQCVLRSLLRALDGSI